LEDFVTTHILKPTAWHNTLGTFEPALRCASGDTVVTETLDAAGADRDGIVRGPRPNPVNAPIFVEGAEPGDALQVEILRMTPTRERP
jgi:amidase